MTARRLPSRPGPRLPRPRERRSLLDIVDHVVTQGVVLRGDLLLGVADVDLVYLHLSAVLCAAERVLAPRPPSRVRHAVPVRSHR